MNTVVATAHIDSTIPFPTIQEKNAKSNDLGFRTIFKPIGIIDLVIF